MKTFWILDGSEKAYDQRFKLPAMGAYLVKEHKAWCINDPSDEVITSIRRLGLIIQFRRYQ